MHQRDSFVLVHSTQWCYLLDTVTVADIKPDQKKIPLSHYIIGLWAQFRIDFSHYPCQAFRGVPSLYVLITGENFIKKYSNSYILYPCEDAKFHVDHRDPQWGHTSEQGCSNFLNSQAYGLTTLLNLSLMSVTCRHLWCRKHPHDITVTNIPFCTHTLVHMFGEGGRWLRSMRCCWVLVHKVLQPDYMNCHWFYTTIFNLFSPVEENGEAFIAKTHDSRKYNASMIYKKKVMSMETRAKAVWNVNCRA